jgi:hypothetical protein
LEVVVMLKRVFPAFVVGSVLALVAPACGGSDDSTFGDGSSGSSGFGGSSGSTSGDLGSSSGTDPGELAACATETKSGEVLPLDIHIMLDASGSMMSTTGVNGTGPTKWAAVKDALKGFIGDGKSAGIGVGLQIFPIVRPGSPATCTSDDQCTVSGTSYGSCFLKTCDYWANGAALPCDAPADCPNSAACLPIGVCRQGNANYGPCAIGGTPCARGTCVQITTSSCAKKECFLDDYDDARVPIAALPGNAGALTSNIDAIPNPPNSALTPTSVAVEGGLLYAKAHAAANPTHATVMVLATDGLPTRCTPYDSASIAAKAASAAGAGVKTFVIGVFEPATAAQGKATLDAIAAGGGTGQAFVISTGANVTAEFQKALDQIRGAALPCEYKVPVPTDGTPDYNKVNVQFTPASGKATVLPQVKGGEAACGTSIGWYYDVEPTAGTPTKIILCPSSCNEVKAGSGSGAKVDVLLGCTTIVK